MKNRGKAKGLLARKMEDADYRRRHEESYELLKLEVQLLNALEKKHSTYSDLAKVLGTQKSAITRDLKGHGLQRASMDRIARMAEALGLRFMPFCIAESRAKQALPLIQRLVAV